MENLKNWVERFQNFIFKIRVRNFYNQILGNQQVNLIARAKLGSHFRSRRVQFFNNLGIIKNKLWDRRIVWWFCSQIFFAHFGASFASSSAAATPEGTPASATDCAHYAPYIRYEKSLQNLKHLKSRRICIEITK